MLNETASGRKKQILFIISWYNYYELTLTSTIDMLAIKHNELRMYIYIYQFISGHLKGLMGTQDRGNMKSNQLARHGAHIHTCMMPIIPGDPYAHYVHYAHYADAGGKTPTCN